MDGTGRFDLSHMVLTKDVATLKEKRLLEMPGIKMALVSHVPQSYRPNKKLNNVCHAPELECSL